MVEEFFSQLPRRGSQVVLLLCTVPVRPPSELTPGNVRLKNMVPSRVSLCDSPSVPVHLESTSLDKHREYRVALTHQWSNMTFSAEAKLANNLKGVIFEMPLQILSSPGPKGAKDGLYDVHLVIDNTFRSENRRTMTVGSAESDLSSSTRSMSTASFVPIGRGGATGMSPT